MTGARASVVWSAALIASACGGGVRELPPLGEVEIAIDTDMPVPRLASRLRIDAYAEALSGSSSTPDGGSASALTWVASRDFLRASPSDWPTSFVVYSPHPERGGAMLVRLRAYLDGKVRDYRGERYVEAPPHGPLAERAPSIAGDTSRRLLDDTGRDVTPKSEPQPLLAIDRLVRVHVVPGERRRVRVVLRGECVGVMANLESTRTCVDDPTRRVSPEVPYELRTGDALGPSVAGAFDPGTPCALPTRGESSTPDGARRFDGEVCVPPGVFVFGWPEFTFGYTQQAGEPERMARVPAFRIDRDEVTVGRWRRALAEGFVPPPNAVAENERPLPPDAASLPTKAPDRTWQCTYSKQPLGRESYPLMCVTWAAARAFCNFYGGDLPLEAQWAYVAQAAVRPRKTAYPWGGSDGVIAPCSRGVFARGIPEDIVYADACVDFGFGPQPSDAAVGPDGDVSVGLAIENLGGSVSEWVRDDAESLDSNCWMQNTLDLPRCINPESSGKGFRGGSWRSPPGGIDSGPRDFAGRGGAQPGVGFRCVREASP